MSIRSKKIKQDCSEKIDLAFFAHGFEYKFLGLFTTDRHLLGVADPENESL